ncbi:putative ELL-associated factor 2-like [Apostichopus japonicus]|uniref:Putative ELL-associated factor 2-like n=1 Tax=Stichopus japonicus TaxID=307972 RepID=A0A2G8KIX0_STIJA|nr:putative ELL-associated factor 2-like [Apostichopus japonicus]
MDKVQAANKVTEMFGSERNELKLGRSFYKNKEGAFHTIRYDFKPASIDHSKAASLDMKDGSEVNISFPNDESKGGPSSTNFKGPMKPCQKDCVLIYDHRSGEFTLERLTSNINVKIQSSAEEETQQEDQAFDKPRPEPSKVEREPVRDLSPPSKFEREPVRDLSPPNKFEREPVRDLSPPSVSPPRAQRPPTPDAAITRTLSEDSSPEPAPVSRSLSQESSSSEEEEEEEEEEEREEVEEEEEEEVQHQQHQQQQHQQYQQHQQQQQYQQQQQHQQHQQQQQQHQHQHQHQEEQSEAESSSSEEEENNSSSNDDSSSEEEEEVIPQVSRAKKTKLETPPSSPPPAKARRGSAQILNQLEHDLSLSSSDSEDSD